MCLSIWAGRFCWSSVLCYCYFNGVFTITKSLGGQTATCDRKKFDLDSLHPYDRVWCLSMVDFSTDMYNGKNRRLIWTSSSYSANYNGYLHFDDSRKNAECEPCDNKSKELMINLLKDWFHRLLCFYMCVFEWTMIGWWSITNGRRLLKNRINWIPIGWWKRGARWY